MPINYSIAMLLNPQEKDAPARAYAKAQINGEMSLKALAKEVSNKSTVHYADVSGVLIAAVETMLAALKEGKQVDFGELGIGGEWYVRDQWTHKCEGRHSGSYLSVVPPHGTKLVRMRKVACPRCD